MKIKIKFIIFYNFNITLFKKNLINIFKIVFIFYLILSELKLIFIKYRKLRSAKRTVFMDSNPILKAFKMIKMIAFCLNNCFFSLKIL